MPTRFLPTVAAPETCRRHRAIERKFATDLRMVRTDVVVAPGPLASLSKRLSSFCRSAIVHESGLVRIKDRRLWFCRRTDSQ